MRRLAFRVPTIVLAVGLLCTGAAVNAQTANSPERGGAASLATLTPDVDSRMVSPENPTGEKAKGAMRTPDPANPDLSGDEPALLQNLVPDAWIAVRPGSVSTAHNVKQHGIAVGVEVKIARVNQFVL